MANNKMLIDASHPEETRVVVVRGNRVEEFDFEAQEKRQLRGNIYLAKVTRVEPSLQAAFIDYGGNRHGFLAFSEIHPDYYQIPAADRQALLEEEEEAQAAEAEQESDEEEDRSSSRRSRRRGRKPSNDASASTDDADDSDDDGEDEDEPETIASNADATFGSDDEDGEVVLVPADEVTGDDEDDDSDDDDGDGGRSMAAVIETDSISEPADEPEDGEEPAEASAEDEKPKKRARRSPRKKKADEAQADSDSAESGEAAEPAPKAAKAASTRKRRSKKDAEETSGEEEAPETAADTAEAEEEKPKKRARRSPRKKKDDAEAAEAEAAKSDDEGAEKVEEIASAEADDSKADGDADADTEADASDEGEKRKRGRKRSSRGGRRRNRKGESTSGSDEASDDDASSASENGAENGKNGEEFENVGAADALEEVPRRARPRRSYKIQEVIRRRQVMLVQVVKEERGTKGAALTTYLSLAGRYSVLMPNTARGGGISRKITNPADRKRLKEIAGALEVPKGMGVILRTAGASRSAQEVSRDFDYLMRLWENVRSLTLASTAPCLVYEEGSLIKRSIRDLYDKDIGEIVVSGEEGYREAKDFMKMLMPSHAKNVKLHKGDQPLLSKFGVESQLDKMVTPQVTLKSGGYLVINQTEALVAIDVNSGRSTREHSIEATALQTNLEAAEEVARQLRLRDLAGLIVIDFIDMEEKRNNRSVEKKLKECLKNDRARIQVGHISHFGLLEMSRQRIRASVLESTMEPCPHCGGTGHIRSGSSFAIQVVRAIEEHLNRNSRNDVLVKLHPAAAIYILNHKRQSITRLEDRYGVAIEFETDASLSGREFSIEKGEPSTRVPQISQVAEAITPMDMDDSDDDGDENFTDMDGDADSGDGDSGSAAASAGDGGDDSDGDQRSGRKRRKRRGRRGRGRDRDRDDEGNEASAGSSQDDDSEGDDDNSPDEEEQEERSNAEAPANAASEASSKAEVAEEVSSDDSGNKAAEEPKASAAPARSRNTRRTGRPGKKVREESESESTEAETATATDASEDEQREAAPPRAHVRRNTRRVKSSGNGASQDSVDGSESPDNVAETVAEAESPATSSETPADETPENTPVAEAADESETTAPAENTESPEEGAEGDKKSGWWGKGGFF
ncbi:MAG: Rne/Rng family ribonuclease [Nitratireductor sp.]|nr:Rne/Rng family ribonuclease [Nitratireductor sp.]